MNIIQYYCILENGYEPGGYIYNTEYFQHITKNDIPLFYNRGCVLWFVKISFSKEINNTIITLINFYELSCPDTYNRLCIPYPSLTLCIVKKWDDVLLQGLLNKQIKNVDNLSICDIYHIGISYLDSLNILSPANADKLLKICIDINSVNGLIYLTENNRINKKLRSKALKQAIYENKFDIVKYLVQYGVNCNKKNYLEKCITLENLEMLIFLITFGAKSKCDNTLMARAINKGNLDFIKYLISIDSPNIDINNAIYCAVLTKKFDTINYFLQLGVHITVYNKTIYYTHCCLTNHLDIAKLFIELGANMNMNDLIKNHIIVNLINQPSIDLVIFFITSGLQIENLNFIKDIILCKNEANIKYLYDNFFYSKNEINFLLLLSCKYKNLEMVKYSILQGADVDCEQGLALCNASFYDISYTVNLDKVLLNKLSKVYCDAKARLGASWREQSLESDEILLKSTGTLINTNMHCTDVEIIKLLLGNGAIITTELMNKIFSLQNQNVINYLRTIYSSAMIE